MSERLISLVFGYLPGIDWQNPRAAVCGVSQRFAVALDTYRPDNVDMYFDHELLLALLRGVSELIPHGTLHISMDVDGKDILMSLDALERRYREMEAEDRVPFIWLEYRDETGVVGYVQSEWYTLIGGPHPYHDSYTFSFYLYRYDRWLVQRRILEICWRGGADVKELWTGVERPMVSPWSRLPRFFHRLT